jgi:hypothetical protein
MKVVVALLRILNLDGKVYFIYHNLIEKGPSVANSHSSISVGLKGPLGLPKLTKTCHQINSLHTLTPSHPAKKHLNTNLPYSPSSPN